MAGTPKTPKATRAATYAIQIVFSTDEHGHSALKDERRLRDEAASWLADLNARIERMNVRRTG